jgi:hypothetical protein
MRVISQYELQRLSRTELMVILQKIAAALPDMAEGSIELRDAHANLQNIRRALARPDFPALLRSTLLLMKRSPSILRSLESLLGESGTLI